VSDATGEVVERSAMQKGYEFEKDRFVVFTADELKTLEDSASHMVEIVAFIPEKSVDPLYYDKTYFIAPDKRGAKPYSLLQQALLDSQRGALAKWASKGRTHIVLIRPAPDGLIFQQLLYADEVRSLADLHIEHAPVSAAELKLALQIIEQGTEDAYDPSAYENEEKKRILAAIDRKIEGKEVVTHEPQDSESGAQVIDLMEALRASLSKSGAKPKSAARKSKEAPAEVAEIPAPRARKPAQRAEKAVAPAPAAKVRARK
jgi:DNA end-binding protein Ku